ncbi:Uma2 family endonuclease [Streptomyces sp. NPDC054940]
MNASEDRIEMAVGNSESFLDELFEYLERFTPAGYKAEVVEGSIVIWPVQQTHRQITRSIVAQLCARYPSREADARIDYPGHLNGLASDVTLVAEGAERMPNGRWHYQDVEFVAEVISEGVAHNDYGPKKTAYAVAEVPVYLIADPYQGRCYIHTDPKDGDYATRTRVDFGTDLDLTGTVVDLVLKTDDFPRD